MKRKEKSLTMCLFVHHKCRLERAPSFDGMIFRHSPQAFYSYSEIASICGAGKGKCTTKVTYERASLMKG